MVTFLYAKSTPFQKIFLCYDSHVVNSQLPHPPSQESRLNTALFFLAHAAGEFLPGRMILRLNFRANNKP